MAHEQARALEQRGIQAAKAGQKDEARTLLQQSLRLDPDNDNAWLWLGSVARNKKERLLCLKKTLELNPNNDMALKAVQAMGIDPAQLLPPPPAEPEPEPEPFLDSYADAAETQPFDAQYNIFDEGDDDDTPEVDLETRLFGGPPPAVRLRRSSDEMPEIRPPPGTPEPAAPPQPPPVVRRERAHDLEGVPMPDVNRIDAAQAEVQAIIRAYLTPLENEQFTWTHKTKGRAGEREVSVLRLQAGALVVAFLIVLGVIGVLVYNNVPGVRVAFEGVPTSTRTFTPTATNTPSATPGLTATPSPTRNFTEEPTFTLSPTISLSITPGQIEVTPRPTALDLPEEPNQAILLSDQYLNEGRPEDAIPLLMTARAQLGQTFDPNPFYYEAVAHLQQGNTQAALALLTEAQRRIDNFEGVRGEDVASYTSLISTGFAQVYLQQAREALASGEAAAAQTVLQQARELATTASENNPDAPLPYLILAQANEIAGSNGETISLISEAQVRESLVTDLNLIIAKGQAYLTEGRRLETAGDVPGARANYENARYQGYYATYINPYSEAAHQLQVESAIALGDTGLAVIFSQGYLLYFPESAQAFRALGDARVAEGNTDLALEAYNRALAVEGGDSVTADVLVSRATLYTQQRRYDLAQQDLTQALELRGSPAVRALRMQAAYAAGDRATARTDAEALMGTGAISDNEIRLIQARILIDEARPQDSDDFSQALTLLTAIEDDIQGSLRPVLDEYLARAYLNLGNLPDALNAINRALSVEETGSRHYLRGLIYEAQDDRQNAIAEYQWVLTWDNIYNYPFAADAAGRIDAILNRIAEEQAQATATVMTATAAIEQLTVTAGVPRTETAQAQATATITAGVPRTETAQAQATATVTAGVPRTETAQAQATATVEAEVMLTSTAETRLLATAAATAQTATMAAGTDFVRQTATAAVLAQTAIPGTSTAAAERLRQTATAAALPSVTPKPAP